MEKKEMLKKIMEEANLLVVIENIKSSFDAVVEKRRKKYFVKILNNIDGINKEEASSLKKISHFFEGMPFIIGEISNNGPLEDYVLFKRFSIFAGTLNTFLGYVSGKCLPHKNSSYYYKVDGEKIRKMREEKGLSLQELSSIIGISKETLYRYEKEQIMARKETLELLESFFNEKLTKRGEEPRKEKFIKIGDFEGAKIKSPFHYILKDEKEKLIVGKEKSTPQILQKYSLTYKAIADELDVEYFFITTRRVNVPYVLESEIKEFGFSEKIKHLAKRRAK